MNKLITLTLNDLRNIMRDNFLRYFLLIIPFLFIFIVDWLIPFAINLFPVISGFADIITSSFMLELPLMIAFVISFMMLDEKDERVFTALRVVPVTLFQFLFYRLSLAVFFSFVFEFLMLYFNNLFEVSFVNILLSSLLYALITPIFVLLEVTFASNKVTGFTLFKGLNFIFIIPAAGFFIHSNWQYLLGIIPSYWPIHFTYTVLNNISNTGFLIFSFLYIISIILLLSSIFKRMIYNA